MMFAKYVVQYKREVKKKKKKKVENALTTTTTTTKKKYEATYQTMYTYILIIEIKVGNDDFKFNDQTS